MQFPRYSRRLQVVEDPDGLGYRLVDDVLLELMSVQEWQALEREALEEHPPLA